MFIICDDRGVGVGYPILIKTWSYFPRPGPLTINDLYVSITIFPGNSYEGRWTKVEFCPRVVFDPQRIPTCRVTSILLLTTSQVKTEGVRIDNSLMTKF